MLPTMCLRATGLLVFKTCHSAELNKIVEATASVNPYDNRMATGCLRTATAPKGGYGLLTGALNVNDDKIARSLGKNAMFVTWVHYNSICEFYSTKSGIAFKSVRYIGVTAS